MSEATSLEDRAETMLGADELLSHAEEEALATAGTDDHAGDPGSLRDRLLKPQTIASFVIAIALAAFFIRRLDVNPAEVWKNARNANPFLFLMGFVVWYGTFFIRAYRWRQMLSRVGIDREHGHPVPGIVGIVEIFLLSWFANCIVPAKLGDAYRSYLLKKESKASFSTTLGTILAERLTDLVVLFAAMSAVGVLLFRGHVPDRVVQTFFFGLALIVVGVGAVTAMWFFRHALQRRLPERVREQYGRLHDAVFACLRRPGGFLGISVLIWTGEGLRVLFVSWSLHAHVSFTAAMFIALMASLLTTLPITPAGLGIVEGAITTVLVRFMDMDSSLALSIALLDRVIGYWTVILVGIVLSILRARRGLV